MAMRRLEGRVVGGHLLYCTDIASGMTGMAWRGVRGDGRREVIA